MTALAELRPSLFILARVLGPLPKQSRMPFTA
jgi:hypothetical protein